MRFCFEPFVAESASNFVEKTSFATVFCLPHGCRRWRRYLRPDGSLATRGAVAATVGDCSELLLTELVLRGTLKGLYVVMAYIVMAYIVMTYTLMAYIGTLKGLETAEVAGVAAAFLAEAPAYLDAVWLVDDLKVPKLL